MVNQFVRFMQEEEGATAIEYGLLAALIAAVIIVSVQALGSTLKVTFSSLETTIGGF